jgi:hypothetical protein
MKRIFLALLVLIAAGCAGVNTIAVKKSEPHQAIPVKDVQLALEPPPNAVLIADIFSAACNSEEGSEAAQADLKRKAASLGANVLVIENANEYLDSAVIDHRFRIEARAYFSAQ